MFAAALLNISFGPDLPAGIAAAVQARLQPFASTTSLPVALHLGRTAACADIVAPAEFATLAPEAFIVARSGETVCAVGSPYSPSSDGSNASLGSAFAALRVLERLGFAFLHPLSPAAPAALNTSAFPDGLRETHSPAHRFRGFHVHTEHPLELVEVLQGADATLSDGSTVAWSTMLDGVKSLFEWLVANRQNHIQWILLAAPEWRASGWINSTERQGRLRHLTDLARSYGLHVGADIPIAEVQQRAWYMVEHYTPKDLPSMVEQIHRRLDWVLAGAGFDYLASESGTTEFTHPDCSVMLSLISATSDYAAAAHGARSYIKCHASTGQTCPDVLDPRDSKPINFNFLPMLASKTTGVLPHTIQDYSLDDPTDGAYGNDNFSALRAFMEWEVANDTREVVFHPETNYCERSNPRNAPHCLLALA